MCVCVRGCVFVCLRVCRRVFGFKYVQLAFFVVYVVVFFPVMSGQNA